MIISCPGKTFLAGEYLALTGGSSLLFCSSPRFELHVKKIESKDHALRNGECPFHQESPAGKLFERNKDFYQQYSYKFVDPYAGAGGWGASTAQFLTLYALRAYETESKRDGERYFDVKTLLQDYIQFSWNGEGLAPSGADLVAQFIGKLVWYDKAAGRMSALKWPFSSLNIALIQTGNKVPTHEHLKNMTSEKLQALAPMQAVMNRMHEALSTENESQFIESVMNFRSCLKSSQLESESTSDLLESISKIDGVLAAKGCGALGADVVFVLTSNLLALQSWSDRHSKKIVATDNSLSHGLEIKE